METFLVTLERDRGLCPDMDPEFALCYEGRLSDELRAAGATVRPLSPVRFSRPWTILEARRRLRRALAEARPDVVICHSSWPYTLFGPVARRAGLPLAFWHHDLVGDGNWVDHRASRTPPDLVVANSRFTAATSPQLFPGARVEVLYYPVPAPPPIGDRGALRREVRRALDTPDDAVVIIQASRLERWKGQSVFVEALGRLRDRAGWVAWVAGGAQRPHERDYLDELRASARAAGIADRVKFLGQRSDVPRLLAAADVHCQPNTGPEPFGIALVEALHAGLPVVTSRLGGPVEVVDETCGVLVPPSDAPALASALGTLIDDPSARARLGAEGPSRARALCDPRAALGRLSALLAGARAAATAPRSRIPI